MPVSKKAKDIYNSIFDGSENLVANSIQRILSIRDRDKFMPNEPIPTDYAKRWNEYWGKYGCYSPKWGWFYAARNGIDDVRYIPATLYYTKLDQHFNKKKLGWGFNDKNYYSVIFKDIKQPRVLVRNIGGLLFNEDYKQIGKEEAIRTICTEPEVIFKPSLESGSGRNIQFIDTTSKVYLRRLLESNDSEYVIQAVIKQHPALSSIHPESINSVRVASLLMED